MINVKVKLFGIFKGFNMENTINININNPVKIQEFRKIVSDYFLNKNDPDRYEAALDSVYAYENKIVIDDFCIEKNIEIAIIPPVCGG